MGIGNLTTARPETASASLSLPLMGIGNPVRGRRRPFRRPALITPHGDRKHRACVRSRGCAKLSLPLMGIGNSLPSQAVVDVPGARLITPHGDRKPVDRVQTFVQPRASLPLMGIGNGARTVAGTLNGWALITPHGDRKPGRDGEEILSALRLSLPLMGIGNFCSLATREGLTTAHSLPLMGIGNPHPSMAGSIGTASSLPLMGIGNPPRCTAGSTSRRCTHYPSWGSET